MIRRNYLEERGGGEGKGKEKMGSILGRGYAKAPRQGKPWSTLRIYKPVWCDCKNGSVGKVAGDKCGARAARPFSTLWNHCWVLSMVQCIF